MNSRRLLWHLVKFQFLAAPSAFWVILGILVMMVAAFTYGSAIVNPARQISLPNFWGDWFLIYLPIQFAMGRHRMRSGRLLSDGMSGSGDFLWTRAVDRKLVFWSKVVMFTTLALVLWGGVYVVVPVLLWLANVPIAMPQFLEEAGSKGVRLLILGFLGMWAMSALERRSSLRDLPGMLLVIAGFSAFVLLPPSWQSGPSLLLAAGLVIVWSTWSAAKRYVRAE